jgi:hypothetical protein
VRVADDLMVGRWRSLGTEPGQMSLQRVSP